MLPYSDLEDYPTNGGAKRPTYVMNALLRVENQPATHERREVVVDRVEDVATLQCERPEVGGCP